MQKAVSLYTLELIQNLDSNLNNFTHLSIKTRLVRLYSSELPPTCCETESFTIYLLRLYVILV